MVKPKRWRFRSPPTRRQYVLADWLVFGFSTDYLAFRGAKLAFRQDFRPIDRTLLRNARILLMR